MTEDQLRALERKARETGYYLDLDAYCQALGRLGVSALQKRLGTGTDFWQNMMYRRALKQRGGGSAGLDLTLPHSWALTGSQLSFGGTQYSLSAECQGNGIENKEDFGLHPFIDHEPRPLTFKETILARMDQWKQTGGETEGSVKRALESVRNFFGTARRDRFLWQRCLFTCTGIVYNETSTRFKIVPQHPALISLRTHESVLPANFAQTPGRSFAIDQTYNRPLTFAEAVTHQGWLAALEGDEELLRAYATIVFERWGNPERQMIFQTRSYQTSCLRPLGLNDASSLGSDCRGDLNMHADVLFARIARL